MAFVEVPVKRTWLGALVTLVLVFGVAPAVFAQGVGSARGTVMDASGVVVAGADVAITNVDTGFSRTVKTDPDGNYGFQSLPIGRYTLKVVKEGFNAFEEKNIVLHVNDALTLDAR